MATVVASAKLPTSIEPPEFNVTTPPVNVVSVIVQPPTLPPVNNTCEPVTLPPAETLNLLDEIALPSSSLIFKIWKGSEEKNIIKFLKKKYTKVSYFKPNSSRSESSEIFIVALKFIN